MPKAPLNREKIVATAIRIADKSGLHAVTLRGIAKVLGVHVTSLYNHIPTKEALMVEMAMALMAETELPCGAISWQAWARGFVEAIQALALEHPGAFQLLQQGPAQGERAMESLEAGIKAFEADGFDLESTQCAIKAVSAAAIGLALDGLARRLDTAPEPDFSQLPQDRYPAIHRLVATGDNTDTHRFVIDTLIDGIEANRNRAMLKPES
ncbi:TetR/AcrR family transcriptional regulator [Parahaliea aestuarii]|uniref:TetR family transcriptional regulator n=1 Tax=Parahaliea aestuarii TaxID=1852021 RepID=A0A5C8ZP78_9GAMM|nr:TetR family transcriptional regulator [Parahaliea aestuarii]TXS89367.1 TetR family transcriptional regulator [Parahaliea aestuarii]